MATAPHDDAADTLAQRPAMETRLGAIAGAARRWFVAHQRPLVMVAGSVLLLALGSVGLWMSLAAARLGMQTPATLARALEALDRGAYVEARHLVTELRKAGPVDPAAAGGPAFVLGAVTFHETAEGWLHNKTGPFLVAARHLEQARAHGFPTGRHAEGLLLLGKSLCLAGRYAACREPLQEALRADGADLKEIRRLLVDAYLGDAQPKLDKALQHNAEYLASAHLTDDERTAAELARCRILLDLGRLDECRQMLREVADRVPNRAEVLVLKGRVLRAQARQAEGTAGRLEAGQAEARALYDEAIEMLRQVPTHDTLDREATRASMYLLGVCLAERDTAAQSAALEQLIRTRKLHFDSPEGLAATLLEADLLRAAGRPAEAVAAYRLALSAAGTAVEYHNPWVPLAEFRGRVVAAFEDLCDGGQFDHAVELLDGFRPIFPHLRTLELTAQTAGRWGDALIRSGAHLPESQARPLQQRARQHFRRAGYAFLQLAEAHRASRRYPDDLWNSAQSLLKGHDFQTARRLLKQYLDEPARPWRAQALVALGQANLALGHVDESAAALQECIEFHPRDPATYTARLWCSKAYVEQGAYDKAEALLRNNLDSDSLTPTSSEWRDSLFALGQLLLTQQRHQEAVKHLQEAVARYPATPRATHGIHLIAQAYREAAKEPQQRLREAAVQTVRAASRREVGQLLEQALQYYQQVQTMLLGREEQSELTALDSAMLRNCLLARGSILFDLARYDEAIEVYSNAATRYQNEPVVLETFVQIAYCYRRQSKLVEARGAVEQAKVVLQQLPPDEDFKVTTNYSRDEWVTLLNRLSS